ncbi:MAG TPA: glucose-6-phosphate isomerase [Armatimonadetes bacterium]|nr:glucose-6-phosphate isomerase [Armatimonadota bacterium]
MVDLSQVSGLSISLDERTGELHGKGVPESVPRSFAEMAKVVLDPRALPPKEVLYLMYRDFPTSPQVQAAGLRYDITVMFPKPVGRELPKTKGHIHSRPPGSTSSYPEVYQVLHGRALYELFGPWKGDTDEIETVFLVEAEPGDIVVVPPDHAHITHVLGQEPVVMANWVARDCQNDFHPIEQRRSGPVYLLAEGTHRPTIQFNPHYRVKQLRWEMARDSGRGFIRGVPIYTTVLRQPRQFGWLNP